MKKYYVLKYILSASVYFFATNHLYPMEGATQPVARYQRITQTYRYSILKLLYSQLAFFASFSFLSMSNVLLDDDSNWLLVTTPVGICGLFAGSALFVKGFYKSREAYKLEEKEVAIYGLMYTE